MNNNKASIDLNTLKLLYPRFKVFAIPIVIILVCFLLLVKVIVPQFENLFLLSREAKEAKDKLSVLKNNLALLSGLNESTLDSQLQIVNAALPTNKDFVGIINAIEYASSVAGVSVGDFQLQIGDLSEVPVDTSKFSSISLNLLVGGSIDEVTKFIGSLSKTLPLSEVTSINLGNSSSNVAVNFYYKPLPPVNYTDTSQIHSASSSALSLIDNLSTYNYNFSNSFDSIINPAPPNPL